MGKDADVVHLLEVNLDHVGHGGLGNEPECVSRDAASSLQIHHSVYLLLLCENVQRHGVVESVDLDGEVGEHVEPRQPAVSVEVENLAIDYHIECLAELVQVLVACEADKTNLVQKLLLLVLVLVSFVDHVFLIGSLLLCAGEIFHASHYGDRIGDSHGDLRADRSEIVLGGSRDQEF